MFERFGEFDSAEEINLTAEGLKTEGDMESLLVLAEENGIERIYRHTDDTARGSTREN